MCLNWIEEFSMKALVVTCMNYQIILDSIPGSRLSDTRLQRNA